ncbi:PREDICTED: phosphopantothenoylcysteine decarboxylase [Bactrocera latifrons]|uniref:Phosphopantothenoylcysteine decarboxylase n=1 Tax=Bactrocera latifrons TaxID=174628 RepID=A0A0K8USB0_BACLA|nr:PREDICTED: phosphopantothenoylcysteine decarboxylase [Bactrocera latifrons]XP_039955382.1 phosphopantothenoylcysteine decarboxylase [Bactrocera tryoni]XP_050327257.1 phosphopantothenoylcysteine decarboxylase [Bactrocera neohumeralis]
MMRPQKNILIGVTGSVATIKLPLLIEKIQEYEKDYTINIKIVPTEHARHFFESTLLPAKVKILIDVAEWSMWQRRGDPVLHIDLGKWADILLIAPLSANTLAKIATGICDNLLTCVVRAWDLHKPLLFCPAMNTRMYDHPLTYEQISKLKSWGYTEIPCISKMLMCGDTGNGAMAEVSTIVERLKPFLEKS